MLSGLEKAITAHDVELLKRSPDPFPAHESDLEDGFALNLPETVLDDHINRHSVVRTPTIFGIIGGKRWEPGRYMMNET